MKHLKKAQSSNIKQIRFTRHIGRLNIYDNSREYEIEDDCYIYEVILENNLTHYVSFGQFHDIIEDEEWLQGEGIASSQIISLSLGAKKKESTNFDALCVCEDDCVSVENHGKHWIDLGNIISIDENTKTAVVKWEETRKRDTVHLGDCKSTKNWTSFQGNGSQQISFVRYHRQRGGSHLLAKYKTCFF
jgi:hypothetical protein